MGLFKLAELIVDIKANNQVGPALGRVRASLESAGSAFDRFGARAGGILAGVAAAAGGALAIGLGKAVLGASDLNETLSKVEQVFGKATGKVVAVADEMAAAFGTPKREILDAAAGIGLIGKAAKLTDDQAAELGGRFARLAADASSFYNLPLDVALEKIRSGLVGEAEPLRALGVLLDEESVKLEALASGIARAGDELTQAQKVQARASLITKGLATATGDLARTQDGFANRLRELQGRLVNAADAIGARLLPQVTGLLAAFVEAGGGIAGALDDPESALSKLADELGAMFGDLKGWLEANKGEWKSWGESAIASVRGVVKDVGELGSELGTIGSRIAQFHRWSRANLGVSLVAPGADVASRMAKIRAGVIGGFKDLAGGHAGDGWRPAPKPADFSDVHPNRNDLAPRNRVAPAPDPGRVVADLGRALARERALRPLRRALATDTALDAGRNLRDGALGLLAGDRGAAGKALAQTFSDALARNNAPTWAQRAGRLFAAGAQQGGLLGGLMGAAAAGAGARPERRNAEFLSAADVARKATKDALDHAAGKDDVPKKQLAQQEKMVTKLDELKGMVHGALNNPMKAFVPRFQP